MLLAHVLAISSDTSSIVLTLTSSPSVRVSISHQGLYVWSVGPYKKEPWKEFHLHGTVVLLARELAICDT